LEEPVVKFLQEIIAKFGVPTSPVRVRSTVERNSGLEPACAPAASPAHQGRYAMPSKAQAFPSTYYRAADLRSPIRLTIEKVMPRQFGEGREAKEKYVASFVEPGSKLLVVSPTKWDAISLIARSDDSDDWPGIQIVLYRDQVQYGGKLIDGIKIRAPRKPEGTPPAPTQPAATADAVATTEDLDDEILF
jgi:hypothetical protein